MQALIYEFLNSVTKAPAATTADRMQEPRVDMREPRSVCANTFDMHLSSLLFQMNKSHQTIKVPMNNLRLHVGCQQQLVSQSSVPAACKIYADRLYFSLSQPIPLLYTKLSSLKIAKRHFPL